MLKARYWLTIICIIMAILSNLTCPSAQVNIENEDDNTLIASIPTGAMKACIETYTMFVNEIQKYVNADNPRIEYLSYPENYDIVIYDQGSTYLIRYTRRMDKYVEVKGGGIDYTVDKQNYKVIDVGRYK